MPLAESAVTLAYCTTGGGDHQSILVDLGGARAMRMPFCVMFLVLQSAAGFHVAPPDFAPSLLARPAAGLSDERIEGPAQSLPVGAAGSTDGAERVAAATEAAAKAMAERLAAARVAEDTATAASPQLIVTRRDAVILGGGFLFGCATTFRAPVAPAFGALEALMKRINRQIGECPIEKTLDGCLGRFELGVLDMSYAQLITAPDN